MKNILNLKNMTQIEVQQAIEYLDVLLELHNKIGHRPISFSEAAVKECSRGIDYYMYSVLSELVKTKEHNWLEEYEHVTRSSSHLRPHYLENLYWYGFLNSYRESLFDYEEHLELSVTTLNSFKSILKDYKGDNEVELVSVQGKFITKALELEAVLSGDRDCKYKKINVIKDILSILLGESTEESLTAKVRGLLKTLELRECVYLSSDSGGNNEK